VYARSAEYDTQVVVFKQTELLIYFGAISNYECEQSHKDNYNDLV